jgi:integrase
MKTTMEITSDKINRDRIVYYVKRPKQNQRATFSIYQKVTAPSGIVVRQSRVENEEVKALNDQFKSRVLSYADVELQVSKIKDRLNDENRKITRGVYVASEANLKLTEEYWAKKYKRRKLENRETQYHLIHQAVRTIGPHPLLGDVDIIQTAVDRAFSHNPNRQRAIASVLNQMRKWFGITTEMLALEKRRSGEVKYLTRTELSKVLLFVQPYHNTRINKIIPAEVLTDLYTVLFNCGARVSESFTSKQHHLNKNGLWIETQLSRKELKEKQTKGGNSRRALFFEYGNEAFNRWVAFSNKNWIDRNSLARNIKSAAKKAFPKNPEKWICVHDLRQSYAIMLIRDYEFNLTQVAKFLGNSAAVCEYYYARFVMDDETLDLLYQRKVASKKEDHLD